MDSPTSANHNSHTDIYFTNQPQSVSQFEQNVDLQQPASQIDRLNFSMGGNPYTEDDVIIELLTFLSVPVFCFLLQSALPPPPPHAHSRSLKHYLWDGVIITIFHSVSYAFGYNVPSSEHLYSIFIN